MATRLSIEAFNVLVLDSDSTTTAQVIETFDRIQTNLPGEQPLELHLWRLDSLKQPALLAAASRDVASADMIVVNLNDERLGSELFQHWTESWPAAACDKPRALVGFRSGGDHRQIPRTFHYLGSLRDLASRKHMDFITNESPLGPNAHALSVAWEETHDESRSVALRDRPQDHALVEEYQSAAYRHSGINE